ncbi:hypothetical protein DPMN_007470 [Dreissena polymorpha]|uniref:Uncharacterized protein n=1 Tax=Dreissena polymorpha TaxID=45954 RepID=A0A9D4MYJ0_DREPO|nr:hypothetical protein DPMN_007470 [Dreissena polymorpha]
MNQPTDTGSLKQPTDTGTTNQPTEESSQLSEMAAILKYVIKQLHLLKQTSQNSGGIGFSVNKNNKSAGEDESYDAPIPCKPTSPRRVQEGCASEVPQVVRT